MFVTYVQLSRVISMPIYNIEDEKLTPIRKVKFKNERELQR